MKGYVDYGNFSAKFKKEKEASDALFIMASEINGNCRLPVGYVLTNGCDRKLLSTVISKSLEAITDCGATALTITFDGLPGNCAAAELLGANFDVTSNKLKTHMQHPTTNENVYFFPDPCHMIKLLRNALEAYKCFVDIDGNEVRWEYFRNLVELQNREGLRAANKLTTRHSNFGKEKMKVRLAVQLLSSSVAVAMNFCEKIGLQEFNGCSATSAFAKTFDRIFDALNSRPRGKGFKAPLASWNQHIWRKLFTDTISYLQGLRRKSDNRLLLKTKRKTCIIGLIVCLKSMMSLMELTVLPGKTVLRYIPTYKLSQDILELFFSTLRHRFGRNNNPNTLQLESALKRILVVRIKPSLSGNCVPQEDTVVPRISALNSNVHSSDSPQDEIVQDEYDLPPIENLSAFVNNVVVYISGFVGRRLITKLDCQECVYSLIPSNLSSTKLRSDCILLSEKDNGGLFIPSEDLITTCKQTELVIRQFHQTGVKGLESKKILHETLLNLLETDTFNCLRAVNTGEHSTFCNHVLDLMKMIVTSYTKIRLHYIARQETLKLSPCSIRNQMTKAVLFRGQ